MIENRKALLKAVVFGTSVASTLAGLVLGGFFLGRYLDLLWGTRPIMQLILILAGVIFGGVNIVITLIKLGKTDDEDS
ncbi:MAG: AtpZ/AtpI family protein [Desulfitobacteriaceae bacterium]|nr:AtpZ/AtpI family protein [Desulfitobacteriaceae bacterium]MDD4345302.1 AtpZ/AtpI family protein [Desulfitobacteriaceae bacterium]MDD4400485.1 AtpZ/AtpI family protein [Desulfitobacteriaceae bacterium]